MDTLKQDIDQLPAGTDLQKRFGDISPERTTEINSNIGDSRLAQRARKIYGGEPNVSPRGTLNVAMGKINRTDTKGHPIPQNPDFHTTTQILGIRG